ncbi:PHO88 [Symbiodinium microadriaticum]|nr:PHO88 [Symbiodinium microadriaticum]
MPEGTKIQVPAVMQMGVEVKPAAEQSVREYDMSKWFEQMQQQVVGCIVLACVHVHWGYVTPLALQCATAPLQLLEAPLVKIHLLHKPATGSLKRPFPAPSLLPFLPPTPEPPKEKPKKDKGKKSKCEKVTPIISRRLTWISCCGSGSNVSPQPFVNIPWRLPEGILQHDELYFCRCSSWRFHLADLRHG